LILIFTLTLILTLVLTFLSILIWSCS